MNRYAREVKNYLEEEKIFYSCEDVGKTDENFIIYAIAEGTPNIWVEMEESGKMQMTCYLKHGVGEEERQKILDRRYILQSGENNFQIFIDEEGSVTALYHTKLGEKETKKDFAKSMYVFLYSLNQCIDKVLIQINE